MNRKRARMRAKRMAGQGLNPATGLPFRQHDPYKDPSSLINPWEETRQQRGRADSPDRCVLHAAGVSLKALSFLLALGALETWLVCPQVAVVVAQSALLY